jgi:hypothetical protein
MRCEHFVLILHRVCGSKVLNYLLCSVFARSANTEHLTMLAEYTRVARIFGQNASLLPQAERARSANNWPMPFFRL